MRLGKRDVIQSIKFTAFSLGAGIIQLLSSLFFENIIRTAPYLAYLIGVVLSVLFNFTLNRRYTFRSAARVPRAMLLVAAFYLVFIPSTTVLDKYFTERIFINSTLVLVSIMLLNFVLEFIFCRFFVYKGSIDTNSLAKSKQKERISAD